MVKEVRKSGVERKNLEAKIAGRASMFSSQTNGDVGRINVEAIIKEIKDRDILLTRKDLGVNISIFKLQSKLFY